MKTQWKLFEWEKKIREKLNFNKTILMNELKSKVQLNPDNSLWQEGKLSHTETHVLIAKKKFHSKLKQQKWKMLWKWTEKRS